MGPTPQYRLLPTSIQKTQASSQPGLRTTGSAHGRAWEVLTTKSNDYYIDKDLNLHTKRGLQGLVNRIKHFFGAFSLSTFTKLVQTCYVSAESSSVAKALLENQNIKRIAEQTQNKRGAAHKSSRIFYSIYQAKDSESTIFRAAAAFGLTKSEQNRIEHHAPGLVKEAQDAGISEKEYLAQVAQLIEKARSSDKGFEETIKENPQLGLEARHILEGAREDVVVKESIRSFASTLGNMSYAYRPIFEKYAREIILSAKSAGIDLPSFVRSLRDGIMNISNLPGIDNTRENVAADRQALYSKFSDLTDLIRECSNKSEEIKITNEEQAATEAERLSKTSYSTYPSSYTHTSSSHDDSYSSGYSSDSSSGSVNVSYEPSVERQRGGKYSPDSFEMGYAW